MQEIETDLSRAKTRLVTGQRIIIYNGPKGSDPLRQWARRVGLQFHKKLLEPGGRVSEAWIGSQQVEEHALTQDEDSWVCSCGEVFGIEDGPSIFQHAREVK